MVKNNQRDLSVPEGRMVCVVVCLFVLLCSETFAHITIDSYMEQKEGARDWRLVCILQFSVVRGDSRREAQVRWFEARGTSKAKGNEKRGASDA